MANLITHNGLLSWTAPFPHMVALHKTANNHYVALFSPSGSLEYSVSPDGVTWSSPANFPGVPGVANLKAARFAGDVLHLWYDNPTGSVIYHTIYPYNSTTNTFPSISNYAYIVGSNPTMIDVDFDGTNWYVAVGSRSTGLSPLTLKVCIVVDAFPAFISQIIDTQYQFSTIRNLQARYNSGSGFLYVSFFDVSTLSLVLLPIVVGTSSLTWYPANIESLYTFSDSNVEFSFVVELDGTLTYVISFDNLLYSMRRTAIRTHGPLVPLNQHIVSNLAPRLFLDSADLYVAFTSDINQANGEVYLLKRTGGSWLPAAVLAGGDSAGYLYPEWGDALGSFMYQLANGDLYYGIWNRNAAPAAPTPISPIGNVAGLTPTLRWRSNLGSPTDPIKSFQVQIDDITGGGSTIYDSGEVVGPTGSLVYPGTPSLAYNNHYQWRVREKDSQSAGGSGTWGPYSTSVDFYPRRGATIVITSITSGGTTYTSFPATIGAQDIQSDFSWTQADSDSTNDYKYRLYAADDVTILGETSFNAIGPPLASGGTQVGIDWITPLLTNGGTFHFSVLAVDSVSGVVSESAHVQLSVVFTPPAAPDTFTATPHPDSGWIDLSWHNPSGSVETILEWLPYTETGVAQSWIRLNPAGTLWTSCRTPNQAPTLRGDYRVSVKNTLGIQGLYATLTNVVLPLGPDEAAFAWINSVADFVNKKAFIAYVENFDSLKRTRQWDMQEVLFMGSQLSVQLFGLRKDLLIGISSGLKFFIPAEMIGVEYPYNVFYGADQRDAIIAIGDSHDVLIYRDRRFPVPLYVKLITYEDQPNDDVNTDMTIELHTTAWYEPLPVSGS